MSTISKTPSVISLTKTTILYFIAGGLSFVAALAFNDAFQSLFHKLFASYNISTDRPTTSVIFIKFIYALLVTAIAIIFFFIIIRFFGYTKIPGQ